MNKLLEEASKIVPTSKYHESIDELMNNALWAINEIQEQDADARSDIMPLNSESAKKTRLNLKKQLDHTTDSQFSSMMSSAIADPSTWPDPTNPNGATLIDIDNHLVSIDSHLANIETLLKKRK